MKKLLGEGGARIVSPNFEKREPLSERLLSEEKLDYIRAFLTAKMNSLDIKTFENAMIILGDSETVQKRAVGPMSFHDLLADARSYPAHVHAYYDPDTLLLSYFSGRKPEDKRLCHVRFDIDFDRSVMGERITHVVFDGPENPHLKSLEGLQVSGGFNVLSLSR